MPVCNAAIICGDSRDRLTEQCIRSFYEHTDLNLCDLTVLDNDTQGDTPTLLWGWVRDYAKDETDAIVIREKQLGGGAVTNRALAGARRNQGEFLYHTASDFYFKAGWLEALLANWPLCEEMGIGLLGAYSHPYHRTNSIVKGLGGCDIHLKDMVAGGSWFMKWETWDKYGPLNEQHQGLWIGSEDTEFNFRLIDAGVGRATLVPEMVVHTGRTASNGHPTIGAEFMKDQDGILIE